MPYLNMLRNLLSSVDPDESAKHSFDHYHVRGLVYLNLLRTEQLTAKLYIIKPGAVTPVGGHYLVNPHSHAYNFHSYVVTGWMRHFLFEAAGDDLWYEHRYSTTLRGEPSFRTVDRRGIRVAHHRRLLTGESYYLTTDQVHTIFVPRDRLTVLFLLQYHDVEQDETLLFTREPDPPSLEGLYARMSAERITAEMDLVRAVLDAPKQPPYRFQSEAPFWSGQ